MGSHARFPSLLEIRCSRFPSASTKGWGGAPFNFACGRSKKMPTFRAGKPTGHHKANLANPKEEANFWEASSAITEREPNLLVEANFRTEYVFSQFVDEKTTIWYPFPLSWGRMNIGKKTQQLRKQKMIAAKPLSENGASNQNGIHRWPIDGSTHRTAQT